MSRRNKKRRRHVEQLSVREVEAFGPSPVVRASRTGRVMDWIMCLSDDRSAVDELFPLPGNVNRTRV